MRKRLPDYFKKGIIDTEKTSWVRTVLKVHSLNTVCEQARCPNKCECYSANTATFLIMGKNCTRNCRFCNIAKEEPELLNPDEPKNVAMAVKELGLKYVVITSVTRDDLKDGGASHFAATISEIKKLSPDAKIEVLTPDFKGDEKALDTVLLAKPDVFNHNIETVKLLYPKVRPMAIYERSLNVLKYVKSKGLIVKTGVMVGLGETKNELILSMKDLKGIDCDILTIGQYVQPSKKHLEVEKYYEIEEFEKLRAIALNLGIPAVIASPLVRSSYKAFEAFHKVN